MPRISRSAPAMPVMLPLLIGAVAAFGQDAAPAKAPPAAKQALEQRALDLLPEGWQVRVGLRSSALMLYVTPPTAEGFKLIYDGDRQAELARQLCPPKDDPVWNVIAPADDIDVVPTVLGKTGLKASCKATLAEME